MPAASTSVRSFLLQAGAAVAAQLSLLAALLFYFGWKRNQAFSDYLGYAESQLNSSVQGYVLSSVPALFDPLLIAAALGLIWRIADPVLVHLFAGRPRLRRWACLGLLSTVAVAPLCAWTLTRLSPGWWELGLPASLTIGVLLTCWSGSLWSRTEGSGVDEEHEEGDGDQEASGYRWVTWSISMSTYALGVIVLLVFWTAGTFAQIQGRGAAQSFASSLAGRTSVTVFSDKDLRLYSAPGVRPTVFESPGAYRYRYEGLKLVAYADGKLFLVPSGWTYDHPLVIVLPEQEGIRVEYVFP